MALFGMFNYSKPGPGVDKDAPKKKRFFLFFELYFRKFWKIVELNLLFCLFCIPLVAACTYVFNGWARADSAEMILMVLLLLVSCLPIGPAMAGITYILRNFAQEKPVFMVSDFWDAFKSNFKQALAVFYIDTIVTGVATVSFLWYFMNSGMSWAMALPLGFCILVEIILMFMRFYTYLMLVTVDLPVKYIIKNSAIFAFLGLKTNVITLFFVLLIAVPLALFFPISLILVIPLGFTTIGFIVCFNSYPYLVKYIIEPHERQVRGDVDDDDDEYDDDEDDEEEEDDDDAPIFTDIGSREVAVQPEKKGGKGKVIR